MMIRQVLRIGLTLVYATLLATALSVTSCSTTNTPPSQTANQSLEDLTTLRLMVERTRLEDAIERASSDDSKPGGNSAAGNLISMFNSGKKPRKVSDLVNQKTMIENELIKRYESGDTAAKFW